MRTGKLRRTILSGAAVLLTPFVAALNPRAASACVGDCDRSSAVTVDEIIRVVNLALGATEVACDAGDANLDGQITVDEIVAAVSNGLSGCPVAPTPTATAGARGCGDEQNGSVIVFDDLQVDSNNDPLLSLRNRSNSLAHAQCFYVTAAVQACAVTEFSVTIPRQSTAQWRASMGGGDSPAAPALPFAGALVCVETDSSGTANANGNLAAAAEANDVCPTLSGVSGFFDAHNGDETLCFSNNFDRCPNGAEYDGCPASIDPSWIENCWSESRFDFVCSAAATPTPRPTATPRPSPILVVESLSGPTEGVIGATVEVFVRVRNIGTSPSPASFGYHYYSKDLVITAADVFSGQACPIPSLAPGQVAACAGPIDVPAGTEPGVYYLGVLIDTNGAYLASPQAITLSAVSAAAADGRRRGWRSP
jgi:hypothetical protein